MEDEWRQCVVDALEIANAEWHAIRTQLEGVFQAWEAANIELCSIGGQLGGINRGLKYLAGMAWKKYMAKRGGLASGRGAGASEGAMRPETQEAGVATSKAAGEGDELPGGSREGSEDRGKGPSGLSSRDKGKGKEKEAAGEETLQEE